MQAAVVTACAREDEALLDVLHDEGVLVHAKASPATTTFQNSYDAAGKRTQILMAQAAPLTFEDVPPEWGAAPIIHLGPIAQEIPADLSGRFPSALLCVTPQGWMRGWDAHGRVAHSASPIPVTLLSLSPNALLILSMEDLGYDANLAQQYAGLAPIVVITQGGGDALVYLNGQLNASIPARQAQSLDPTGAGDVFAASLMVRYGETRDILSAVRFAHTVAARAIGGEGTTSIPLREILDVEI